MKRIGTAILILLFIFPITLTAQPRTALDLAFEHLIKRWHIPGAVIRITDPNHVRFSHSYGWADRSKHMRMTPYSRFRIGSISKTITAIATLKWVQAHAFKLDDPIYAQLALKPLTLPTNPQLDLLTIRHLLNMSSGWYTYRTQAGLTSLDPMFGPWPVQVMASFGWQIPPTCRRAAQFMMSQPFDFKPGTDFSYSNLNYCLLGLLIDRTSRAHYPHCDYRCYVKKHVLAPLGIYTMDIGSTRRSRKLAHEVTYYLYDLQPLTSELPNQDGFPYSRTEILRKNPADAGWVASASDLSRLMTALGQGRILKATWLKTMAKRPELYNDHDPFGKHGQHYFGMGFAVESVKGHTYWVKTGSFTGTSAILIRRDDNRVYVALFNTRPRLLWDFFDKVQKLLISYHNN